MELNITAFVTAHEDSMERISSSVAESGREDVGDWTWGNAMASMADESAWLTSDLDALREHFSEYGAWDDEELSAMGGQELNALLAQFIAGVFQARANAVEEGRLEEWEESEGGRLYAPEATGEWFYYAGG